MLEIGKKTYFESRVKVPMWEEPADLNEFAVSTVGESS